MHAARGTVRHGTLGVLVLLVGLTAGCADSVTSADATRPNPTSSPTPTGAPMPWMPGGMGSMMTCGLTSEVDYLRHMIAHHTEAITAAGQLARSTRAELRELGNRIVATQTAEIDRMRGWLAEWYPDVPVETTYRPMMRDLSGLSGDELDRAFLADMIPHHAEAVMTSQMLLQRGADHEEVRSLAAAIRDAQQMEITLMRGMQSQWFPSSAPGPSGSPWSCGPMMGTSY